jgi:glycosyltransferase involved in cell wall biosynthesis
LHLRDSPWVDGPGRTILETAARIDRSRIDYHIAPLVPDDGAKHPLVVAARARGVPVQPVMDTGVRAPLVERVTGLLDKLGIEILHSSEFRTNLVALRCRKRRPSLKIVSTAHGWIANDIRGKAKMFLDRALLRRFDRVIAVSHAVRKRLPRWWILDGRMRVIHNALMLDSYGQGLGIRAEPAQSRDGPIRLLAVGRLSREKGLDLLLRALAELAPSYPQLQLTIAGSGPLETSLRLLSEKLALTEKVRFIGYVTDMPNLYVQSDLVVQGSLTEGLPNVILEAAYLGVPVVATDAGGTNEVIEHGVSGWLVPVGSVAALVAGLRRYLESPDDFNTMARASRQRVEKQFSIDSRTIQQTRLYEELAEQMP